MERQNAASGMNISWKENHVHTKSESSTVKKRVSFLLSLNMVHGILSPFHFVVECVNATATNELWTKSPAAIFSLAKDRSKSYIYIYSETFGKILKDATPLPCALVCVSLNPLLRNWKFVEQKTRLLLYTAKTLQYSYAQ